MILETERLYLRELDQGDFEALCQILKDLAQCFKVPLVQFPQI